MILDSMTFYYPVHIKILCHCLYNIKQIIKKINFKYLNCEILNFFLVILRYDTYDISIL